MGDRTDSYGTVARSQPVFDMAKVGKTDRAGFAQNNVLPRYRGSTLGNDCAKPTRLMSMARCRCDLPRDRGVDSSAEGNQAIWVAAEHGELDVVRYLCDLPRDRGVDPRACHAIIESGIRSQVVRYLRCLAVRQFHPAAGNEVSNGYDAMTARSAARLPVLALWALVRGPHGRVARVWAGRVHWSTGGVFAPYRARRTPPGSRNVLWSLAFGSSAKRHR